MGSHPGVPGAGASYRTTPPGRAHAAGEGERGGSRNATTPAVRYFIGTSPDRPKRRNPSRTSVTSKPPERTIVPSAAARPGPHDGLAEDLRGFGPVGILAILVIFAGNLLFIPLSALLVLLWRAWAGAPWGEIGYVLPEKWARSAVLGLVLGVAFKLLMKAIVMPLLGAPPINAAYTHLAA